MKTTTVRIDDTILERVDDLARTLSRSRSWVINQAIDRFLDYEEWFVKEVEDGLAEVEKGEVATREEVAAKFSKWGVDAHHSSQGFAMRTVKIVYWQEPDGMWLGHLEAHPEYMTQGETLDELKENLKDILKDVDEKVIPFIRTHEDMAV